MENKKLSYYIALVIIFVGYISFQFSNSNIQCEVYFSPGQNCTNKIVEQIDSAQSQILVQAFSFTCPHITDALIRAHKRGVKIVCLFDKSQLTNVILHKLAKSGIEIKIDKLPGIAHNKVMIIDERVVLTGSFNFTNAAQKRNAENSVHIYISTIIEQFKQNFYKRYEKSHDLLF